jgi:hypothetical protein
MEISNVKLQLSLAFASAIGNDEADYEDKYTFLIYIHLGIIKATGSSIKKARAIVSDLLIYIGQHANARDEKDYGDIKLLFENNTDILLEIVKEIWDTDTFSKELKWMETWLDYCKYFLKDSAFNESFIQISKLAYDQTGLNNKSSFVKYLLSAFNQVAKNILCDRIIRIA